MNLRLPLSLSAALLPLASAGAAHAQAFYLQEQSAKAAGRAFSGEAADTGAGSLWWNPAAIAGMDRPEVEASASGIFPRGDVIDRGTLIRRPGQGFAPVGGDADTRDPIRNGVLPSGAIAVPLGRAAVGLAVTSPFSFTTDYPSTSWARYSADRTKLRTIDVQPSLAVELTPWLRVGGAANVEHVDASLSNALPNLLATLPDGEQALTGNGWDLGWTAGVQLHNSIASVGITYKSAIRHKLNGEVTTSGLLGPLAAENGSVGTSADFSTPAQVIVGARFNPEGRLAFDVQAVAFQWSKFDAIRLGAPLNVALPEDYRDSFSVAGGLDYTLSPAVTLRAGVQRGITPTQDGERDARVPDSNRWNVGGGASFNLGRHLGVDVAGNYIDFADASIDRLTAAYPGTAAQTPVVTNGVVEGTHAYVASLGGHYRF